MRTLPTRSAAKEEGAARRPQQQPLSAHGLPAGGGLPATLIALHRTHGNRFVQRLLSGATHGDVEAPSDVEETIQRTRGGGHPLQPGVRMDMESAFGADFSGVRLHTDANADTLNRSLSAYAFTTGRDIYFRQGQYDPEGMAGRRLLAHELTHVVQQAGSPPQGKLAVGAPGDVYEQEADRMSDEVTRASERGAACVSPMAAGRVQTYSIQRLCAECVEETGEIDRRSVRTPEQEDESGRQTAVPSIQRDFAIAPPGSADAAITLTAVQMTDAIRFNTAKLGTAAPDLIRTLRDVLGISREPPVIDDDFVNAVVRWQAANNVTQDGKLGPDTAAPLFAELRAEGLAVESRTLAGLIRRGRVLAGPTYTPDAGLAPTPDAGQMHVGFGLAATFAHDPDNGVFASCCEVRQQISWDAAMAASFATGGANPIPHAGFPAAHPADTFIEDRDAADALRYGHRGGFGGGVAGNQYVNAAGGLDQANGTRFQGHDDPHMLTTDHGQMQFRASVVDVCNNHRRISGFDTITINW